MVDVLPVSDPNSTTMAQRVVQYQAAIQLAEKAPHIYDLPMLHRQMIEVLGIKNADKIIPNTDNMPPLDPVSENMNLLTGKPAKAVLYQDHEAHIAAHSSFMQDPSITQAIGQNPMAQQIGAAIQAHIAEHLGFLYRKQIEERLGAPLPSPNEALPEEVELQLSRLVAEAGKQLTQIHQQQQAQQQAQQQQEDPMFKLQMEEVGVKKAEVHRKAQKDQADIKLKNRELDLKAHEMRIDAGEGAAKLQQKDRELAQEAKSDETKTILQEIHNAGM